MAAASSPTTPQAESESAESEVGSAEVGDTLGSQDDEVLVGVLSPKVPPPEPFISAEIGAHWAHFAP